ncbi:MAG: DNA-binding protein [bacterium]|nr:DNA-binding protein [bacterium]
MMFKACKQCGRLVPKTEERCPYCGSKEFSEKVAGAIFILDAQHSIIAKILNKEEGIFALKRE